MSDSDPDDNYKTPKNLRVRGDFVGRYSNINWFGWIAERVGPVIGRVLDVGCGVGWVWHANASVWKPDHLLLLDKSEQMIASAKDRLGDSFKVDTVIGDAVALPFDSNSFDTVFAMHMLSHVGDVPQALAEMRRVLKPGGRIVVTSVGDGDLEDINILSRSVFGSAGSDIVQSAFGTAKASAYLNEAFDRVDYFACLDTFAIDDVEATLRYIQSFPPGESADEAAIKRFGAAVAAQIEDGGGIWKATRKQDLYIAR